LSAIDYSVESSDLSANFRADKSYCTTYHVTKFTAIFAAFGNPYFSTECAAHTTTFSGSNFSTLLSAYKSAHITTFYPTNCTAIRPYFTTYQQPYKTCKSYFASNIISSFKPTLFAS
jgi:hypothetical protein